MDLSAFSKDTFDPKEWINNTFALPEAQGNEEEFAADLVTKLQSFIEEVNLSLAKTAEQVIQNIPRITREVENMRQEAVLLQEQMNAVRDDVMKVERDSSNSMHTLLEIDRIKSQMQEACKALREADNWSTLSADVDEVFASGDISAISAKLIGMQNSLEILADVPDYQERYQRLENLKDKLEAIISPQLIATFNSQTNVADVAMVYMKIFKDIRRLHRLQKYYHNFQKKELLQQWTQIVQSDAEETLTDWMNNLYDVLLSTWHSQMGVCNQLLLEIPAVEVLSELLVDVLSNLNPSLESCFDAAIVTQADPVQYLIDLKQITDRLAKSLDVSIQAVDLNFLKSPHVSMLAKAIYAPYRIHVRSYAASEQKLLVTSLDSFQFESDDLIDVVSSLGDSASKVFLLVQKADNRCHMLTQGCAYPALFQALKGLFKDYLSKLRKVQIHLKKSIRPSSKALGSDWVPFQQALLGMQISGDVLLQLERLEQLLKSNTREIERKLKYYSASEDDPEKVKNPFQAYDDLLLSPDMKSELHHTATTLRENVDYHPLGDTLVAYRKLCADFGSVVVDSVLFQIKLHFHHFPKMKIWSEESVKAVGTEAPTFSLSPLEYITEVGQFLMTIPQHIEPFILQDNPALIVALKNFKSASPEQQDSVNNVADYLLECLANNISNVYMQNLMKITSLTPTATRQLITDIAYFYDVLDDLGLSSMQDMQALVELLKASSADFSSVSEGKPSHLVNVIKAMRKLTL